MKRLILLLIMVSSLAFGEVISTQNIAVVDTSMVLEQYNKRTQLEDQLDQRKKEYDKVLAKYKEDILMEELKLVQKGEKPSEEDFVKLDSLKDKIDEKLREFDYNLNSLYNDYMYQLNSDIATAVLVVGKEKGFDIVFHMGTTFYGGTDITKEVIDFLNKGEKISLITQEMTNINNDTKKYKN